MSEFRRGYVSPLGGAATSGDEDNEPGPSGAKSMQWDKSKGKPPPIEPGTPGYQALRDTFKSLGIDRPETKEEMITAVKNILAGKNRTYNEMMTADTPSGFAMKRQNQVIPSMNIAPPTLLWDFLKSMRDLPQTVYHGFQDVLGDRMQKTTEQVGKEAYESFDRPTVLNQVLGFVRK